MSQSFVPGDRAIVASEGRREPGTCRGESLEAERGEHLRGAGIPRIRQQERLARLVQRQEVSRGIGLCGHVLSVVTGVEQWRRHTCIVTVVPMLLGCPVSPNWDVNGHTSRADLVI